MFVDAGQLLGTMCVEVSVGEDTEPFLRYWSVGAYLTKSGLVAIQTKSPFAPRRMRWRTKARRAAYELPVV